MRLRSFHGETMSEAMRQVREALGTQAVIVATRDDEQGGVRVTAAVDDSPNEPLLQPPKISKPEPPPSSTPGKIATAPAEGEDVVEIVAEQLMRHSVPAPLAEQILSIVTHFADHDALIALGAAMDKLFK
ncbi:MAG: GTPase, partial [Proteobacteria bacterium]|nr:GTPase [Pseudomonadota bacterium]